MKLKFDREKADRLYSINTAEILEEQSEELNDIRIYHVQHNITGQPAGIKQLADLYVKHLKKLSIIKAESIAESIKSGDHQLSEIKNEMLEYMNGFIKQEHQSKNIDIKEQLSLLQIGLGAISSMDNIFKKNIIVTQNLCNNIIEERISTLEPINDTFVKIKNRRISSMKSNRNLWKDIHKTYGMSKISFGKKINFITDKYRRTTIFRDVGHAYYLSQNGFHKPAVILIGSVIEELLRLYIIHKGINPTRNNFNEYIKIIESKGFLKSGINALSDSVRHFRNYVHLSKETDKSHAILKSTAVGAVSNIFTLANDF